MHAWGGTGLAPLKDSVSMQFSLHGSPSEERLPAERQGYSSALCSGGASGAAQTVRCAYTSPCNLPGWSCTCLVLFFALIGYPHPPTHPQVRAALSERYRSSRDTGKAHDMKGSGVMHPLSSDVVKSCLPSGQIKVSQLVNARVVLSCGWTFGRG